MSTKLAVFASILEEPTEEQARRTASMPFVLPHHDARKLVEVLHTLRQTVNVKGN